MKVSVHSPARRGDLGRQHGGVRIANGAGTQRFGRRDELVARGDDRYGRRLRDRDPGVSQRREYGKVCGGQRLTGFQRRIAAPYVLPGRAHMLARGRCLQEGYGLVRSMYFRDLDRQYGVRPFRQRGACHDAQASARRKRGRIGASRGNFAGERQTNARRRHVLRAHRKAIHGRVVERGDRVFRNDGPDQRLAKRLVEVRLVFARAGEAL